jgi:hypothetical protein
MASCTMVVRNTTQQHHATPVARVRHAAADQPEHDRRDRHRDPHRADRQRRVGERENLKYHGETRHRRAGRGQSHPGQQAAEGR